MDDRILDYHGKAPASGRMCRVLGAILLLGMAVAGVYMLVIRTLLVEKYRCHVVMWQGSDQARWQALERWAGIVTEAGVPHRVFEVVDTEHLGQRGNVRYVVVGRTRLGPLYLWADERSAGLTSRSPAVPDFQFMLGGPYPPLEERLREELLRPQETGTIEPTLVE